MKEILKEWRSFIRENERPAEEREAREKRMLKPGRRSWVPGYDEVATLALGIAEDESGEEPEVVEIEIDDEDEDEVMFRPGDDVSIDVVSREEDDDVRKEAKKKVNCSPGNPNHFGSEGDPPGGFATTDAPGSWSLDFHSSKTGCEKGKLMKTGGKSTRWTKAGDCGRDGPYLCSDPKRKKWDPVKELLLTDDDDQDEFVRIRKSALERLLLDELEELELQEVQGSKREREIAYCRALGLKSFQEFLRALNSIRRAEDGKLMEPADK